MWPTHATTPTDQTAQRLAQNAHDTQAGYGPKFGPSRRRRPLSRRPRVLPIALATSKGDTAQEAKRPHVRGLSQSLREKRQGATVSASQNTNKEKRSASGRRRRPLKAHNDRDSEQRFSPTVGLEVEVARPIQPAGASSPESRPATAQRAVRGRGEARPGKRRCSWLCRYEILARRTGFLNKRPYGREVL